MAKTFTAKKFHYLYKTTNLVNGRYYFGMHSTNDLNDGYLGSGTLLRRSILKYGAENFKKEIIAFCSSRTELEEQERCLIEQYLQKEECMNLKPGGAGGFCNEKHAQAFHRAGGRKVRQLFSQKHRQLLKEDPEYARRWHDSLKSRPKTFLGKKHTEETRKVMSEKAKIRSQGKGNNQYGKHWITNGIESRSVPRDEEIPEGWRPGRVIKKRAI